jgi:hypothetical protein
MVIWAYEVETICQLAKGHGLRSHGVDCLFHYQHLIRDRIFLALFKEGIRDGARSKRNDWRLSVWPKAIRCAPMNLYLASPSTPNIGTDYRPDIL